MMLADPSGNVVEFKCYVRPECSYWQPARTSVRRSQSTLMLAACGSARPTWQLVLHHLVENSSGVEPTVSPPCSSSFCFTSGSWMVCASAFCMFATIARAASSPARTARTRSRPRSRAARAPRRRSGCPARRGCAWRVVTASARSLPARTCDMAAGMVTMSERHLAAERVGDRGAAALVRARGPCRCRSCSLSSSPAMCDGVPLPTEAKSACPASPSASRPRRCTLWIGEPRLRGDQLRHADDQRHRREVALDVEVAACRAAD